MFNDGYGTFPFDTSFEVSLEARSIFAADLDGGGDIDLATSNRGGYEDPGPGFVSVLLNDGDGAFASYTDHQVGDSPCSIFAADLDGDGDLDVVTANYDSDNISILLNHDISTDVPLTEPIPIAYSLTQNYPNPFNLSTIIEFGLPKRTKVQISIYNVLGQVIRTLLDEERHAGEYEVVWDGKDNAGQVVG